MVCATLLLANVVVVGPVISRATRPTIAEPSYAELQSLSGRVGGSQSTVLVARHGLEWLKLFR